MQTKGLPRSHTPRTILFVHISKTAGSTLKRIIPRQYPRGTVLNFNYPGQLDKLTLLSEEQRGQLRAVVGHIVYGLHEMLPQPCDYITFLRHPVERTISEYFYARRHPRHRLHKEVADKGMPLSEFTAVALERADNEQTRRLSGNLGYDNDENVFVPVKPEDLDTAKRNLEEHFRVVGLTDHFDESLLMMKAAFAWSNINYMKVNVTRNRPAQQAMDAETIARIEAAESLDMDLYAFAEARFQQQREALGDSLVDRLQHFQRMNQLYSLPRNGYERLPDALKSALRKAASTLR